MTNLPWPVATSGAAERLFRALIEHSWDSISLVTTDAKYRYVSPATSRILGFAVEELVGRNVFDLMLPEDQPHSMALFAELLQKPGGSVTAQIRYRHQDGSWKWLDCIGTNLLAEPDVQAVVVNFRDVTDRKEAEDALRESSQLNKQIIANVGEGIVVYDHDLRYILFNPYMEEMSGLSSEQVAGQHPWDVFPYLREAGLEALLRQVLAGETIIGPDIRYTVPHTGRSGWGSARFSPLRNAGGDIVGVIGTVRDISQRKQADDERRTLETRMQHAQKLESLGVLAGGLAHDFNNLLTGILGNASLALHELPPHSQVRETLQKIETAALRAADLTRQMLAYAGKAPLVMEAIDLTEVVREMASLLQTVISKKAVLHFDCASGLPAMEADPTQIRQVVMNLMTNASDAIGTETGTITIRTSRVQADRTYLAQTFGSEELAEGCYVSLEVSDTGCGMDEDTRSKIFDPFFTTKFTGRGLGLAAVLGIVRGHRGGIKVYSEPGRGSTVQVLFPATRSAKTEARKKDETPGHGQGSGTILVVDDEDTVRSVVQAILKKAGFQVLLACDGREGLEVFRSHGPEIRAVLLDLTMPKMGGEEVFGEMQLLHPDVPVVFMSGFHQQDLNQLKTSKGPAGFVKKPFRADDLLGVLLPVLGS